MINNLFGPNSFKDYDVEKINIQGLICGSVMLDKQLQWTLRSFVNLKDLTIDCKALSYNREHVFKTEMESQLRSLKIVNLNKLKKDVNIFQDLVTLSSKTLETFELDNWLTFDLACLNNCTKLRKLTLKNMVGDETNHPGLDFSKLERLESVELISANTMANIFLISNLL